ncbi:MAG TPA: hypothetical protein VGM41_01375 [Chitinophagaceae bacterium]
MTASIENIVQHLFHQPTLQTVSVDELQQMTQEYPSFAAARFLLLKKMQDTSHPDFSTQLHKTAIYFNNPLWLQLLLLPPKETSWQPSNNYSQPPELPHTAPEQEYVQEQQTWPRDSEPVQAAESPVMQEILDRLRGHIHEAGDIQEQPWPQDADAPAPDPVPAELHDDSLPPVAGYPVTDGMHEAMHAELAPPVVHIPAEIAAQDEQPREDDFAPPFPDPEPEIQAAPENVEEQAPAAPTLEAYTAPAEEKPLVKTIIETPSAKQDLLFEPYHTIDYFASLGIRLDKMEPNPQDKLGKQLRSFTEWLKSMKKLPQASIEKVLGENEESAVVAAASHSIVGKDVITEAMAEVFEKQGLYDKAIEVYHKLSLLNPSKSAYFADRINALKRE